jgi:hypothetical protein
LGEKFCSAHLLDERPQNQRVALEVACDDFIATEFVDNLLEILQQVCNLLLSLIVDSRSGTLAKVNIRIVCSALTSSFRWNGQAQRSHCAVTAMMYRNMRRSFEHILEFEYCGDAEPHD